MVTLLPRLLVPLVVGAGPDPYPPALRRGGYPWYDPARDRPKAIRVMPSFEFPDFRIPGLGTIPSLGNLFVILLFVVVLGAFLAFLIWTLRTETPAQLALRRARAAPGGASQVGHLPPGLDLNLDDLWGEARRRRGLGDFAGATICLFVHQLLSLEREKRIRLAPGRTARQLVRSVSDGEIRGHVEPTLRLFERVFYGHHAPVAAEFEPVWVEAEALERRWAPGASS